MLLVEALLDPLLLLLAIVVSGSTPPRPPWTASREAISVCCPSLKMSSIITTRPLKVGFVALVYSRLSCFLPLPPRPITAHIEELTQSMTKRQQIPRPLVKINTRQAQHTYSSVSESVNKEILMIFHKVYLCLFGADMERGTAISSSEELPPSFSFRQGEGYPPPLLPRPHGPCQCPLLLSLHQIRDRAQLFPLQLHMGALEENCRDRLLSV